MRLTETLRRHMLQRPLELKRLKAKGGKVVAYNVGDYVPEELIHAAGAAAICQIHGGDPDSVEAAHALVSRFMCPFARAQIGYRWLKEQAYYDLPDLLVIGTTCQHLRKAADIWNFYTDVDVFRLGVPQEYDTEQGLEYFVASLRRMKARLERLTGNTISEEKLRDSILLYNRMRGLYAQINEMRWRSPSVLGSLDYIRLHHAGYLLAPEVMTAHLEAVLGQVQKAPAEAAPPSGPRLLLVAPNIALGDYKILELVQEAGGLIVSEQVTEGLRSCDENVAVNGADPLEALAARYLQKAIPGAFMRDSLKPRFEQIVQTAQKLQARGVIWYQLKMCETYDIEAGYFSKHLREQGISMLKLDSEYDVSDRGPIKTRIEAFLEGMIGG